MWSDLRYLSGQTSSHGKCYYFPSNFSIFYINFKRVCASIIDKLPHRAILLFSSFSSRSRRNDWRIVGGKIIVSGWLTKWSTVFVGLSFFVLQKVVPVTRPVFEVVPMFLLVWVNIQYAQASSFQIDRFRTEHIFLASY